MTVSIAAYRTVHEQLVNLRDEEYEVDVPPSAILSLLTEGSMPDNTVARLQSTRVHTPLSPLYYMQGFGSVFIFYGSGSGSRGSGWRPIRIRIRIRIRSGSRALMTKN
jgi:hypothetical protein